ncbi:MAG TPA: HAD family hydrolase [Bacilli bacterium]
MAIKAVLFDLDDTLLWDERSVSEAFAATCLKAQQAKAVDPGRLEEAVRKEARELYESFETFPFTKQIGINPYEALWATFSGGSDENFYLLRRFAPHYRREAWRRGLQAVGVSDPKLAAELAELFPRERRNRPYVFDETFPVLNQLAGTYKLLLLTNGAPDLQEEKIRSIPGLAQYFDHIVISGNFGQGKPAQAIFLHALELLGIAADEGIMVGDKLTTDILGANSVGLKSVWINRRNSVRSDDIIPAFEIDSLLKLADILEQLA